MSLAPLLSGAEAAARLRERVASVNGAGKHPIYAFFSSVVGGVTRDPGACVLPIDDHMATRGHAVFDTANVSGGVCYGLGFHLERFLDSAGKARIDVSRAPWLGAPAGGAALTRADVKQRLKDIILDTIAASGKRDSIYVRYWLSAARGDFAIHPGGCLDQTGNLYVVVHGSSKPGDSYAGVVEATVSVPLKSRRLATLKSTNYLINVLCAMEAVDKAGEGSNALGLQMDENGNLAEFSIGCVGLVGPDGVLRSPKQDRILASTTLMRAFQLANSELVPRGLLTGTEFRDLSPKDMLEAKEVLELGGGDVQAVVRIDGHAPNGGKPGPVAMVSRRSLARPHAGLAPALTHLSPFALCCLGELQALRALLAKERLDSYWTDKVPYEHYVSSARL
jgi:branched-subunit amino acid aminotransferase/4-amino-4-deoxychorismate lyase